MTEHTAGHSVLVIPVPTLNGWVRGRTAFYDSAFLGSDAAFVNAHITMLGPWITDPTTADLARVGEIASRTEAFEFSLADVAAFPDGLLYLAPTPAAPFSELTTELATAFPDYPPYGGAFGSVVPHLTLDQTSETVSASSVRASLGAILPATAQATRIDLQWWENHNCHVMASWPLAD